MASRFEERRVDRKEVFLAELDNATRPLSDATEITQTMAAALCDYLNVNRCAYADVEADEDTFNLLGDFNRGVPSIVGRYTFSQFGEECLRLMRAGLPFVVEDSEIDPRTEGVRASYEMTQIRSGICVSLLKKGGFVAAMAVHQITPRRWRPDEVELLQVVAARCWESIERTRVSRELVEREQRLRLAQKAARIGSFDWYISENKIIWTPELEDLYGVVEGAFEGRLEDWSKRVVTEDANRIIREIEDCLSTNQIDYSYEFRAVLPDGSNRWLRGRAQFVYDTKGAPVRMIGVNIDIDAQRRAEEERQMLLVREQEARQTAELLNRVGPLLLAERDPQVLAQRVTDLATEVVGAAFGALFHNVVNQEGESYMLYTLSGAPREVFANFPMPRSTEVFGPTFRGEGILRSDDITTDPRYGRNAPNRGMPKGHLPVRSYLAAPIVSRTGEVFGGLFFGHPETGKFLPRHEDVVAGVAAQAAIAFDNARLFAASGRAQSTLRTINDDLRRANADLEQFAYAAAHDLQEPLRMVTSYTQLLGRRVQEGIDAQGRDYMNFIIEAARRMSQLLEDLLAYTETTRCRNQPLSPVILDEVAKEAVSNLSTAIAESGSKITIDSLPIVAGRWPHLLQLFQNLFSNAIKYRREGVVPCIDVKATHRDQDILVAVSDNGRGIPREYHEQIFGVFKRLHGKEIPGTGIGLAICQRVVESAGGKIWVESAGLGHGSTFYFTLPTEPPFAAS